MPHATTKTKTTSLTICKTSVINCLKLFMLKFLPYMFIYPQKEFHFIFLDYSHWYYNGLPWCKASSLKSNMNLSNILNVNAHIKLKIPIPKNKSHINYSAIEPVLFEKHCNIKLSHSVFRVTTFFQFDSIKIALSILLQYAHDANENLETFYSKFIINNIFDSR